MRPRTVLLALLAALALVASSCASDKDTGFPQPTPTPKDTAEHNGGENGGGENGAAELDGPIDVAAGNVFEPKEVTVKVGTTVTWEQSDSGQPHTVTSGTDEEKFDSHPDCRSFNDPCMQAGDEFEHTFEKPGEFVYFCRLHGSAETYVGMVGTITVEA